MTNQKAERNAKRQNAAWVLFWIGLVIAVTFAGIGTWSLMHHLRSLTAEEVNATIWANGGPFWFLFGETAPMRLRAFEGRPPPVPIEIMVFLVLGSIFVLLGEYKSMRLKRS